MTCIQIQSIGNKKRFVKCCDNDGTMRYALNKAISSCKPISIPNDDRFFKMGPHGCMNYVRSLPAARSDCTFGPMEQVITILNIPYRYIILLL